MNRCTRRIGRFAIALLALGLPAALAGAQGSKAAPPPADAGISGDQIVGPGYRRVFVEQHQRITQEQVAARIAAGKPTELDPVTGEVIVRTFEDHLPLNWIMERPPALEGQRVDSFGNPIVNDTPGLPAWAQRDVDALRGAIVEWRDELARQHAAGADTREVEGILGNFIGQAITRAIAIDDLVNIDDPSQLDNAVAGKVLDYLHFYENIRSANQQLFSYQYSRTVYPARIAEFAARHERTLDSVQALEAAGFSGRGVNCYDRSEFARGMTNLSGQTDIWVATGDDDSSADIPIGFPVFWFYPCQLRPNNDTVRVSTNGYLTFFQQGMLAQNGVKYLNDPLPAAADPNAIVAPWWDDLIVATSQGTPDRVSYKTEGVPGTRVFTVEWFSMSRLNGDIGDWHFFQAKLYETSGVIELDIALDWNADSADSATVGIEDYTASTARCGPNCGNLNALPPPSNYRFTPERPLNDDCINAEPVVSGSRIFEELRTASADGDASCGLSSGNRDRWYTFTAPCTGTLHINTCGSRNTGGDSNGPDTVISAHSGCPGTAANQLACNDDASSAGCSVNDSVLDLPVVTGQTVLIRVSHFGAIAFRAGNGEFQVAFDFAAADPIINDSCSHAVPIVSGQTVVGSLLCASNDGSSGCGNSDNNVDAWCTFTAPRRGTLTVDLCGSRNNAGVDSGIDGVLSLHSGCPGTISNELTCNDDGYMGGGCNDLDSQVTYALESGQQVLIRVSHYGSDPLALGNGQYMLHASFSACGSADFDCDGDSATDADIEAFFRCIAGNCPAAPCTSTADFNLDGDAGTDADIEAFFRVLAGGSC
jgi:hypothetical protein